MTAVLAAPPVRSAPPLALRAPWAVFGALLLAWLCANRPQPLAYAVADWVRGAATFSHQQRLADDVRAVLAEAARPTALVVAEAVPHHTLPATPTCPDGSLLQRPEWSLAETLSVAAPPCARGFLAAVKASPPASFAADVPHPPPRAAA